MSSEVIQEYIDLYDVLPQVKIIEAIEESEDGLIRNTRISVNKNTGMKEKIPVNKYNIAIRKKEADVKKKELEAKRLVREEKKKKAEPKILEDKRKEKEREIKVIKIKKEIIKEVKEIKNESLTGKKRGRPQKKESNIEKYISIKKQKLAESLTGLKRKATSDGNK